MAANPDMLALGPSRGTVLVVDDEAVNRLAVRRMLTDYDFEIIEAANGKEACEACLQRRPDLILMDIMMPVMNGLDATVRIKRHFGDTYVPVIFLTAVADEQQVLDCIEVGGDDFLVKPLSGPLLKAKVDSSLRFLGMHRRIAEQRDELLQHKERLQGDMEIAKKILETVESQDHLNADNVRYLLRPMELMNGDMILAARRPAGDQVFMVGDFTGHGLPAAIGVQTVNGIFNAMVSKGLPLGDIVHELNRKMRALLPLGRFLSASLIELESTSGVARIWNGGMPDVMLRGQTGAMRNFYPSTDLPLGIVDEYEPTIVTRNLTDGDLFVIYSDGVVEAHDEAGELFGRDRLCAAVSGAKTPEETMQQILNSVSEHVQAATQNDDLSILVVQYARTRRQATGVANDQAATLRQRAMTWEFALTLWPEDLRDGDPVARVVQVINAAQAVAPIRTQLFLILTELFSNALEHGLLGLDSGLKREPEGFAEYYGLRASRLAEMHSGRIDIRCTHEPVAEGGRLKVSIHHDGVGFDSTVRIRELAENAAPSGRGIPLVKSLCDCLEYDDQGRRATATYVWRQQ